MTEHLQTDRQTTQMLTVRRSGATEHARGIGTASESDLFAVARLLAVTG